MIKKDTNELYNNMTLEEFKDTYGSDNLPSRTICQRVLDHGYCDTFNDKRLPLIYINTRSSGDSPDTTEGWVETYNEYRGIAIKLLRNKTIKELI